MWLWIKMALKYGPPMLNILSKIYKRVEHDYNRWQDKQGKAKIQNMKRKAFVKRARLAYNVRGNDFITDSDLLDILDDIWRLHNNREPRRYT